MIWDPNNHEQRQISVLIFEDNPADAKLMLHQLQKAGFAVQSENAKNADQFKTLVAGKTFDVVLADFYVPGWTGIEAIRWLRQNSYPTPIILVTGSLGDEQAVACLREGASDYVLKDKLEHLPIAVSFAVEQQQLRAARDRALAELRESEEQYRLLFNSNPQPMWVFDRETLAFLAVNDAALFHYGYSREEFLAMTIKDVRPPEEVPRLLATLAKGRNREDLAGAGPWRHRKKNGDIIFVEVTEGTLRFGDRPAALTSIQDVTQRRVLEQQFLQAQKMEAVGRLAGGVAHDFNNLLMVISSSAQLIQDGLGDAKTVEKYSNQICHAADKAGALTRQLLAFSRQQVLQPAVLSLNDVIKDIGTMLPRVLGEDIEMFYDLSPQLRNTNADRGQVEQIIMNLAVNARDAMPEGGTLTIETRSVELDADYLKAHGVVGESGWYVMLAVSDTGIGMTPEVQSRIFEPFFTTKEVGKGTGLGLATVYGIVKQSGGWIWTYSEVGQGTSFKIYLPASQESVKTSVPKPSVTRLRGTETILLVEDEETLRQVTAEYMERRGYRVLQADNGPHAVQVLEEFEGTIDVLITDVVMPGFGGPKVAEFCRSKRPSTKVIFVSGYAEGAAHHGLIAGAAYLQKPLSLNVMAETVRTLINSDAVQQSPDR